VCRTLRFLFAYSLGVLRRPFPKRGRGDRGDRHHTYDQLAVSLPQVQRNFADFGLLAEQVGFLEGWFKDTLPAAPIRQLALARLDGDLYESTDDALRHLYPRLAPGGFLIVDDYGAVPACRRAVEDYRAAHGIDAPIQTIDWTGIYWRKPRDARTQADAGNV
jgi:O-methyltransferase